MIDVGWSELMAIAVILIVVVGPKDLPAVLRGIGQMTRKVRGMADEFRKGVDEFIRESELKDIRDGVEKVKGLNFDKLKSDTERQFNQTIDPLSASSSGKGAQSPGALPPVDTSSAAASAPTTPEAAAGVAPPAPAAPAPQKSAPEKKDA